MKLKITIKALFSLFIFTILLLIVSINAYKPSEVSAPAPYETTTKLLADKGEPIGQNTDGTPLYGFPFKKEANESFDHFIKEEINYLVEQHAIPSWHLKYLDDEGYQMYYYKMTHLSDPNGIDENQVRTWDFYNWKLTSENRMVEISSWYKNKESEIWDSIIKNMDVSVEYLDPNEILGMYYDSHALNQEDHAYMYLIWTSEYLPSEFVNILTIKDKGTLYNLYNSTYDKDRLHPNWFESKYYHYKDSNITLWLTPISSTEGHMYKGLPPRSNYAISEFTYGLDDAQFDHELDCAEYFKGNVKSDVTFDFIKLLENNGQDRMKLCTHAYTYITDIEAQSTYSLSFGGYMHYVHFNLDINPDKIYRVDTKYTISNDNKDWYQFWLSDDEHTIFKSLTPDKARGGFLGLHHYQGFKEGAFSSVNNPDRKFKYELLLDYDDQGWRWKIFTGQEYKESDYKRISEFQILRINYLLDEKVYDVKVKMDTIEGDTYNILSPDLIEDEASALHTVKTWTNDAIENIKSGFSKYKLIFFIILGVVGGLFLLWLILKIRKIFKSVMSDD